MDYFVWCPMYRSAWKVSHMAGRYLHIESTCMFCLITCWGWYWQNLLSFTALSLFWSRLWFYSRCDPHIYCTKWNMIYLLFLIFFNQHLCYSTSSSVPTFLGFSFPSFVLHLTLWESRYHKIFQFTVFPSIIETGAICHAFTNDFGFPPSKFVIAFNIHDL